MAAIELEGVEKSYGDFKVLKGIVLEVKEGEIFGILGPNGVGKTTLFQTVIGLLRQDDGKIVIDGEEHEDTKKLKRKISYLPADISFYGNRTARQNLEFFAELADTDPDIDELIEMVKLEDDADRKVKEFSTGMKKRLGIAQSLIKEPEIIIYDEPTTGLDPQGKKEFKDLARKVNEERGKTVLISSHITTEIDTLCDRFAVLKDGKVAASGTREELGGSEDGSGLLLETGDSRKTEEILGDLGLEYSSTGNRFSIPDKERRDEVLERLVEEDVDIKTFEIEEESLESAYLRLTGAE